MYAGVLRAFARDQSGASSSEYALLLLVAGTGLTLSTFMLGKAVSDSLIRSASLFASWHEPAATAAASATDTGDGATTGTGLAAASSPEADTGCKAKGSGICGSRAKAHRKDHGSQ